MRGLRVLTHMIAALFLLAPWQLTSVANADSPPALIISEIKIRNDTAGFNEYIELYNPGSESVSLNLYTLAYINTPTPAVDQEFTAAVIGDGLLEAGQHILLAKNDLDPNLPHAQKSPFSSLSDSGGTLRILDSEDAMIDEFAWTSTSNQAVALVQYLPNTTATKTQSFLRSRDIDNQYELIDHEWSLGTPEPESSVLTSLPEPQPEPNIDVTPVPDPAPEPEPEPSPTETPTETPAEPTDTSAPAAVIQITELLPNPAPPATDSKDEYIELYNPNEEAVDLTGYKLQSGNTFSYSYMFDNVTLGPHEYRAFFVTETGTILSNTSGQARLLGPNGTIVAQTNAYDSANDGDGWALVNNTWQWTTSPTPNSANELALPILKAAKTAVAKKTAVKKATAKKATPAKTKKAAATKTPKTKKTTAAPERAIYEDPADTPSSLHPGILAGVGATAVLYGLYEYRHDARNLFRRFQRYREVRRATGT